MQAVGPSLLVAVGANGRTLAPALEYMRIRGLAAPACLVMNVAQGACIGQQDSWTPLQVISQCSSRMTIPQIVRLNQMIGASDQCRSCIAAAFP